MTENSPPQTYSGSDVFVSYASQDAAVADAIVRDLEAHGIKCWIAPRDVRPGTVYADAIVGAINESKALVLVLSANAMPSAHIGREVERAASKRKQLIAFRVDATPLSRELEYFLSNSQWIDVPKLGMPAAMTVLAEAVRQGSAAVPQTVYVGSSTGGSKRKVAIAAAIVGVGVAVAGAVYFWSRTHSSVQSTASVPSAGLLAKSESGVAISDKSIAVLPLANESGDPSQQYFSDGLSENLITALTQFPGLKVIGRTSAFQFRDSKEDAHSIGVKLGVARLLEGSVQKSGETVRVRADLIDTTDGSTQWSERYDRPYKDLFALQDDITHAVVVALQTRLLPGEQATAQSDRPPSGSLEAYNALLQGQFYGARDTESDVRRAIVEYRRATQLDPKYAFAWCALSWEWSYLAGQFLVPTQNQDELKNAQKAADRALALAPGLAAAHLARATVLISPPFFDWKGALAESRRALELAPNDPNARFGLGAVLATLGEVEQAIELTQQSLAADPLHASRFGWLSTYLIALNRLDEAERAARTSIELLPAGTGGGYRGNIVVIELLRGNAAAALATAQQEPSEDWRYIELALARQVGDDRAAADAALRTAIEKVGKWSPYNIADIYAVRGDSDKTFEWLDRAWVDRETTINGLLTDPFILRFKDDPRFAAFCRKVGLPVPGEKRTASNG